MRTYRHSWVQLPDGNFLHLSREMRRRNEDVFLSHIWTVLMNEKELKNTNESRKWDASSFGTPILGLMAEVSALVTWMRHHYVLRGVRLSLLHLTAWRQTEQKSWFVASFCFLVVEGHPGAGRWNCEFFDTSATIRNLNSCRTGHYARTHILRKLGLLDDASDDVLNHQQ